MNRLYQVSQTLGVNLMHNQGGESNIEFVLVDLGSRDGLQEWVLSNFQAELESGFLQYYFIPGVKSWNAPVAKNTAHYLAKGEFLMNLDCDNFTGDKGGQFVLSQFDKYGSKLLLHQFNGLWTEGTYGRIGMHRSFFFEVGGYDEAFEPMGHQDSDLIDRLYVSGLRYRRVHNSIYNKAIPNTKEEGIRYCESSLTWAQMDLRNERTSKLNVYAGRLVANGGVMGIREGILAYKDLKD